MLSLRRRALLGGVASAVVSIGVGALAISSYIDRQVLARFDLTLQERHTQIVVGLSATTQDPTRLEDVLFDPAYRAPYSGRYWQITTPDGKVVASASLLGETFPEPSGRSSELVIWNMDGPEDEALRGVYQKIQFEDGSMWGVSVAESRAELFRERAQTRQNLALAFALLGLFGLAGTLVLVSMILSPVNKLREDVAHRWDSNDELKPDSYPEEVAPLVRDINALLHRNRDILSQSRRQAADLAHSLKTPTSVLRNELELLSNDGVNVTEALAALDRVDAQLGRSLARMRGANTADAAFVRTDLTTSIARLQRLFDPIAAREDKSLDVNCPENVFVRMDRQDIEEVIGNLVDNALKWGRAKIALTVRTGKQGVELLIEDDGPGIPKGSERAALRSGGRLDTQKPGTGLGLAIAQDLLNAYGADLQLERSAALGGLAVHVTIPAQI